MTNKDTVIMNRIKTVHTTRAYGSSPMFAALCTGFFLFVMSIVVSLGDVIRNTMGHGEWSGRFSYTYTSFISSRFIVHALAFLIALSCLLMFYRSLRSFRLPFKFLRS